MWALLGNLLGGITGAVGKILPDRNRQNDAQSRINEAEVGGAPASILRLWRSFLGWMLSLLFCWEVAGRLIIPLLFPALRDHLPPSALNQIMTLLLGSHSPATSRALPAAVGTTKRASGWCSGVPCPFAFLRSRWT